MYKVNKFNGSKITTYFILCLFGLAFYYLAYRYPLQINSASTSPTYKDTPAVLQYFKYIIYIILLYVFMVMICMKKYKGNVIKSKSSILLLFGYVLLFMIPCVYAILTKQIGVFQIGIFFLVGAYLIFFNFNHYSLQKVNKFIFLFINISIIFEIIELVLFKLIGRLPALAYNNSISVRFGSLWDDPNGFAIFISFVLPFLMLKQMAKIKKIFYFICGIGMLLLAQSLTGIICNIIALFIGIFILFIKEHKKKYLKIIILLFAICIIFIIIFNKYIVNSTIYLNYMYNKQGSLQGHANSFYILNQTSLLNVFGFNPLNVNGESGYINLFTHLGLFYILIFLFISIISIKFTVNKINKYKHTKGVELYYGILFYQIAYILSMINLPLESVFPLNLLFVIFNIIVYLKPIEGKTNV